MIRNVLEAQRVNAIEVYEAPMPEATTADGIAPPVLVGIAVGDIAVSLVNSNQSGAVSYTHLTLPTICSV